MGKLLHPEQYCHNIAYKLEPIFREYMELYANDSHSPIELAEFFSRAVANYVYCTAKYDYEEIHDDYINEYTPNELMEMIL